MKNIAFRKQLLALSVLSLAAGTAQAAEITVSAAASLTNAFKEIAQRYEAKYPDAKVQLNFGASGALLQQMAKGAPVDVFASADQATMDKAEKQDLINPKTRHNFARNTLVLIVPADSTQSLPTIDAAYLRRVAAAGDELSLQAVVAAHTLSAHRRVLTRHVFLRLTHLARHTIQATRREDAVTSQLAHVIHLRVLRQVADSAAAGHRTVSGQGQTGKHLSHSGLTGTVAAHQTDLVALIDAEGDLFHEQARACTQFEVLYSNHGCLSGWRLVCRLIVLDRRDSPG